MTDQTWTEIARRRSTSGRDLALVHDTQNDLVVLAEEVEHYDSSFLAFTRSELRWLVETGGPAALDALETEPPSFKDDPLIRDLGRNQTVQITGHRLYQDRALIGARLVFDTALGPHQKIVGVTEAAWTKGEAREGQDHYLTVWVETVICDRP